jgi:hypothetical protein
MTVVAPGNPENYTIGGMRFYFAEDVVEVTDYAVTGVSIANKTFSVATDVTALFTVGAKFSVSGSTGNDGEYYVVSSVFTTPNTVITVEETPADTTADGDITRIRKPYLYLGNVVTGEISSDITFLDHFTTKTGSRTKDRSVIQEISVAYNFTLDEPDINNMNFFMLGGAVTSVTGPPVKKTFKPFTNLERNGGALIAGVSDTGNEWVWKIRKSTMKPDGAFSYNSEDWSQFSFILDVLSNAAEDDDTPFGDMDHYGVGQDLENLNVLPE